MPIRLRPSAPLHRPSGNRNDSNQCGQDPSDAQKRVKLGWRSFGEEALHASTYKWQSREEAHRNADPLQASAQSAHCEFDSFDFFQGKMPFHLIF